MSDNYKVLSRAKEAFTKLLHVEKWSVNQVVKETGLNHAMVCQIRDEDPVGIKVWDTTIDKIRTFLEKYDAGIKKPVRKNQSKLNLAKNNNEFDIPVSKSMASAIPKEAGIQIAPGAKVTISGDDLIDELNALGSKFKLKGWNLEARLSKIFIP